MGDAITCFFANIIKLYGVQKGAIKWQITAK